MRFGRILVLRSIVDVVVWLDLVDSGCPEVSQCLDVRIVEK
jgi:hypothetical protein